METAIRVVLAAVASLAIVGGSLPSPASAQETSVPQRGAGYHIAAPGGSPDLSAFNAQIEKVSEVGGRWVRFGVAAEWAVEEWGLGDQMVFDESVLDTIDQAIDNARAEGLQVYLVTADSYYKDDDRDLYRTMMSGYWSGLSDRFSDRVAVWQVYNEPNGRDYVGWDASVPTDDAYLEKLAADIGLAREVIHARNPGVLVTTNAGGFPVDEALEAEWQRVFDALGDSVDAVSVSAYPQFNETAIAELPDELEYLGARYDKPVIVAEVGLQTCDTCGISEEQQGYYVGETVDSIATADVLATLVYELQDRGTDGEGTFGALRLDGTPKSASRTIFDAVGHY